MIEPVMLTAPPPGASHTHQFIGPPAADSPADGDGVSTPRISAALPADLLEQVRGRIRLLAGLFLFGFGLDLALFLGGWAYHRITGSAVPEGAFQGREVQWVNLGAVLASAGLWWAARRQRVSPGRLHTLGLAYEIGICFAISMVTFWQQYLSTGLLPNLTWVPAAVIMFPLVMPGPPRRMLTAAILAAATSPGALLLLQLAGRVRVPDAGAYFQASFGPFMAVGFAYFAARMVYGLGRQVVKAREMGSYQLGELLGRGGMGEVYRATHRMLARPAAIKLIRPEMLGRERRRGGAARDPALPPRGRGGGQPAVAAYRGALRLRGHRGPDALLRDGAARRDGPRVAGAATRAAARRAG